MSASRFKIIIALFLLLCVNAQLKSQEFGFAMKADPYLEFSDGLDLPEINYFDPELYVGKHTPLIPIGFNFKFHGKEYDSVEVDPNTSLLFKSECILLLNDYLMPGRDTIPITTEFAYKNEGIPGKRICKIQLKNFSVSFYPANFLNMQIWFLEENNSIEIHFGKNNLDYYQTLSFRFWAYHIFKKQPEENPPTFMGQSFRGNGLNPTYVTLTDLSEIPFTWGYPGEDKVYVFTVN